MTRTYLLETKCGNWMKLPEFFCAVNLRCSKWIFYFKAGVATFVISVLRNIHILFQVRVSLVMNDYDRTIRRNVKNSY